MTIHGTGNSCFGTPHQPPPSWESSEHGIDSVMIGENFSNLLGSGASVSEHIAWMANSSNMSLLPDPTMMEDDHDEHDDGHGTDMVCYDMSTHTVNPAYTTEADCEAAGLMWTAGTSGPGDHDDHDDHEDHVELTEGQLMEAFNASDADGDQLLNISEIGELIERIEELEEGDHHAGYMTIHIQAEGDYGFALPMDVEFHILMGEGGHDDHAGHDGHEDDHGSDMVCYDMSTHTVNPAYTNEADCQAASLMWTAGTSGSDDHDDHEGEEDDDHDDHAGEEGALDYDPHSWLNPLAFMAQASIVEDALTAAFPAGEEVFKANAASYTTQLLALHVAFDTAFGEGGACMVEGQEKIVASNHNAYSYIAVQYDIQFMTVHGLDPEGEPSPEDVAKVVDFINEEGITVLFVEEYTDQSAVQSIVDETGVSIQTLYTMEMAPSDTDDTYMTMMTKNLENLVAGIGC
ncbi:metal ABC transporter substrate-binding protein [Euryarchaeota archaeon]|nr:metal ABC transporter substrate-binding protein [Euryarchaeota archaeon]